MLKQNIALVLLYVSRPAADCGLIFSMYIPSVCLTMYLSACLSVVVVCGEPLKLQLYPL